MTTDLQQDIRRRLETLQPASLTLVDDSARHAGHAGAATGGSHFRLRIVAVGFTGLSRVARHRLVYDSLSDLMHHAIHALAIEALTPTEAGAARAAGDVQTPVIR